MPYIEVVGCSTSPRMLFKLAATLQVLPRRHDDKLLRKGMTVRVAGELEFVSDYGITLRGSFT